MTDASKEARRWSPVYDSEMRPSMTPMCGGMWVSISDYRALAGERDALQATVEEMREALEMLEAFFIADEHADNIEGNVPATVLADARKVSLALWQDVPRFCAAALAKHKDQPNAE